MFRLRSRSCVFIRSPLLRQKPPQHYSCLLYYTPSCLSPQLLDNLEYVHRRTAVLPHVRHLYRRRGATADAHVLPVKRPLPPLQLQELHQRGEHLVVLGGVLPRTGRNSRAGDGGVDSLMNVCKKIFAAKTDARTGREGCGGGGRGVFNAVRGCIWRRRQHPLADVQTMSVNVTSTRKSVTHRASFGLVRKILMCSCHCIARVGMFARDWVVEAMEVAWMLGFSPT